MRHATRTVFLAVALAAAVSLPASAAPSTVGGPKATSMSFSFTATGPQQHVLAETTAQGVDPEVTDTCVAPRCYAFPFALAGAKRSMKSTGMSAQITWTLPTSRFWLEVMDVTKAPVAVGECFTFFTSAGPSATVEARLPVAHKYAIWVSVEQVIGASETVKGVVHSPAKDVPPPSQVSGRDPTGLFLNPCQG